MGWFDDEDESTEAAAPADPAATASVWGSAMDAVDEWTATARQEVSTAYDDVAAAAQQKATQFADNAQTQFEADPVGFVGALGGAPIVSYDTDSSDGTLAFHAKGAIGNIDADWKEGTGSQVHAQAGMDWGSAPYMKADVVTDDQGEITDASGTAKITIPLEAADVKADWSGGYHKTADGYTVNYSQNGGASVDGVEMMAGLHGGYQDHGDHGYTIDAGPQASVGMGKGGIAPGFDVGEVGFKTSDDLSYGELDGQTTYGASQTDTLEAKVLGQTVAQVSNTAGVQYSDGPQGEQLTVSDSYTATLGTQTTGQVSATGGATYVTGTDAAGAEIDQVTLSETSSVTPPGGQPSTGGTNSVTIDLTDAPPVDAVPVDAVPVDAPPVDAVDLPLVLVDPDPAPADPADPTDVPADTIDLDTIDLDTIDLDTIDLDTIDLDTIELDPLPTDPDDLPLVLVDPDAEPADPADPTDVPADTIDVDTIELDPLPTDPDDLPLDLVDPDLPLDEPALPPFDDAVVDDPPVTIDADLDVDAVTEDIQPDAEPDGPVWADVMPADDAPVAVDEPFDTTAADPVWTDDAIDG